MANSEVPAEEDPEIAAIGALVKALQPLPKDARQRVVRYVTNKLGISSPVTEYISAPPQEGTLSRAAEAGLLAPTTADGISPSATKWMQRNGFNSSALGEIFSIGAERIELLTTQIPGASMPARMRNVL